MTASEKSAAWQAATAVPPLLELLQNGRTDWRSPRKLTLLLVGAARRTWPGAAAALELEPLLAELEAVADGGPDDPHTGGCWERLAAAAEGYDAGDEYTTPAADALLGVLGCVQAEAFAEAAEYLAPIDGDDLRSATVDLVAGLRDVYGDPFAPPRFDRAWRTATAVGLARGMYESRDFAAMPILADALQDAGCDAADVLDHCRGPGPHARGCWVVDLVLGRR